VVRRSQLEVDGATVAYTVWPAEGEAPPPSVVLIHGTSANQHWWTHLVGLLGDRRQVVALDLTGHGDSDHRRSYDLATWSREVLAVVRTVHPDGRPAHLVGHSLGGVVAAVAATDPAAPIASIAMCESVRDPKASRHPQMVRRARRFYGDREEALARFRTIPTATTGTAELTARIAERSVTAIDGRWTFMHDPNVPSDIQPQMPCLDDVVAEVACPKAVVVGEHGLVDAADRASLQAAGGGRLRVVEVPGAGHHPMLDAPEACAEALVGILAAADAAATPR
jgi:pimeloyl-ACP methyl ester carboxylesterase